MIYLIGELNPYGSDPRYALYDEPASASGYRLRTHVLGLERRTYLDDTRIKRRNLCEANWQRDAASMAMEELVRELEPGDVVVTLGRRVSMAHRLHLQPFHTGDLVAKRAKMLSLPHPSGLCREWNEPLAVKRARDLLRTLAPNIRWGELGGA